MVSVDTSKEKAVFADGSVECCGKLITTVPLNHMCKIADLSLDDKPSPYTSVLVINVGGKKGRNCPNEHWLYIPGSRNDFHRVGFYSNVSDSFLPKSTRLAEDHVSIYVEKSFVGGVQIYENEVDHLCQNVVEEIMDWGFLEYPEVIDPTWIEVAYTWSWPGDTWAVNAIEALEARGIFPVGRFARWRFQGMADSIQDGFAIGRAFRGAAPERERKVMNALVCCNSHQERS